MPILNDYECSTCHRVQECWTVRPAPDHLPCEACSSTANRLFSAVGLGGRAKTPSANSPKLGLSKPSLCTQYPQVPGLCHMSESAGRMWVAKYQGDTQKVERELAHQEARATEKPLTMADAITHNHHPTPAVAAPVS